MKMMIEKQAAAAAHLNSPSRLEAFAADSPPRRRPRTPSSARGEGGRGRGGGGGGGGAVSPPPRRTDSGGGIALSELVSAASPPRKGASVARVVQGGAGGEGRGESARRSLAQETYTKTFSGMQVGGVVG